MIEIGLMKSYELAELDPSLFSPPCCWWSVNDIEAQRMYASKHTVLVPEHQAHEGQWVCNYMRLDAPTDEPLVPVKGCLFKAL